MTKVITAILFLFALSAKAQVTFSLKFGVGPSSFNTTTSSHSVSVVAGRAYLYFDMTTGVEDGTTLTQTSSIGNADWTEIINYGTIDRRIKVWVLYATVTGTESFTITHATQWTGRYGTCWEVTGVASDPVKQTASNSGTSADPSLTLSPVVEGNGVFAMFANDRNPFTSTVESGWTEYNDGGFTVPTTGITTVYYSNNPGDNTLALTSASSTWIGVAVEFRQATTRRIIQSN